MLVGRGAPRACWAFEPERDGLRALVCSGSHDTARPRWPTPPRLEPVAGACAADRAAETSSHRRQASAADRPPAPQSTSPCRRPSGSRPTPSGGRACCEPRREHWSRLSGTSAPVRIIPHRPLSSRIREIRLAHSGRRRRRTRIPGRQRGGRAAEGCRRVRSLAGRGRSRRGDLAMMIEPGDEIHLLGVACA